MPNRVGRVNIWTRLIERFSLEPILPIVEKTIGDSIVPVTSIDTLLQDAQTLTGVAVDLTATAGTYTVFHTVPDGKRWNIKIATRAGTTGSSRMRFRSKPDQDIVSISLTGTGGAVLVCDLTLEEGGTIGMDTSGNGADTDVFLSIHLLEEDAFVS